MEIKINYEQMAGEVKERNRFFKALREIQKIVENTDKNKFETDSLKIGEICKDALNPRQNKISEKTGRILREQSYDAEYILSREFMESFQT